MAEWHHQLNGPEFEQTLGHSEGRVNLTCCIAYGIAKSWT